MPEFLKSHMFCPCGFDALKWYRRKCWHSPQQLPVQPMVRHSNSWELEMTPLCQLPEGRRRGGVTVYVSNVTDWAWGRVVFNPKDKWTHHSVPVSHVALELSLSQCFKKIKYYYYVINAHMIVNVLFVRPCAAVDPDSLFTSFFLNFPSQKTQHKVTHAIF